MAACTEQRFGMANIYIGAIDSFILQVKPGLTSDPVLKKFFALTLLLCFSFLAQAQEGFWVPENLPDFLNKEQKFLRPQDASSEKEYYYPIQLQATMSLDQGNCTGVIISQNGLLLTNYHCIEPYLRVLEAEGKIDLSKGFFLQDQENGPILEGLTGDVLVKSVDATDWDNEKRDSWLNEKETPIRRRIIKSMEPSFGSRGIVTNVFDKVSLVAVPPESLALLGGNEGNWQWPRYSSDFVVLRVHRSDPIHQKQYPEFPYLKISKAISKNMDVFVGGYPASSFRNSNSRKVQNLLLHDQSTRLKLRKKRLNIYSDYLEFNPETKLPRDLMVSLENEKIFQEYELRNAESYGLIEQKKEREKETSSNQKNLTYDFVKLDRLYDSLEYYNLSRIYLNEGLTAPKIFLLVFGFSPLEDVLVHPENKEQYQSTLEAIKRKASAYFEKNDPRLEKELFFKMVMQYYEDIPSDLHNPNFQAIKHAFEGDVFRFVSELWDNSIFTNNENLEAFLNKPDLEKLNSDPMYTWVNDVIGYYFISIAPRIKKYQGEIAALELRISESLPSLTYPEANGTLRVSRGKIKGFQRNETDWSEPFCTVSGLKTLIERKKLPDELKKWIANLDDGLMITFLSEVEVSMGNSGSPILNSKGELVGLAFDQNIEGLGNRYYYDAKNQKCIGLTFEWIERVVSDLGGMPDFFEKEFHQ